MSESESNCNLLSRPTLDLQSSICVFKQLYSFSFECAAGSVYFAPLGGDKYLHNCSRFQIVVSLPSLASRRRLTKEAGSSLSSSDNFVNTYSPFF